MAPSKIVRKESWTWYRGIPYRLDLVRCRRALVQQQVDGDVDSMQSLAGAVGISRSTASRFFSGRPTSLAVTLKILAKLHLKFEDVAREVRKDGEDGPDGTAGVRARVTLSPRQPDQHGASLRLAGEGSL
jgi:transcriptional regulator with XRE-family HTH domain